MVSHVTASAGQHFFPLTILQSLCEFVRNTFEHHFITHKHTNMKKILTLATAALLFTGAAFACDGKGKGKHCCKDKKECKKSDAKVAKKEGAATTKKA